MRIAFYLGRTEANPGARLFDLAVCWWTRGDFSHCEMVVDGPDNAAVCWSSSFRDGGVRRKVIDLTTGHWVIVECEADPVAVEQWFRKHEGAGYDVPGLFGFVLPFRTQLGWCWFCSESCAASMGFNRSWEYSPNSLYQYLTSPGAAHA